MLGFLGKVVQTAGHDVSTVARGNSNPGGGVFGFLNKNIAQPVENNVKSFAHPSQLYNPIVEGLGNSVLLNEPKVIAGNLTGNVQAVANANARLKAGSEQLNKNISNPLFLGTAGGDGVKEIPEKGVTSKPFNFLSGETNTPSINLEDLNKISQAKTPAEVKIILGDTLPQGTTNKLAPALAHTTDPNIIKNIISRELAPTPPPLPRSTEGITPTPVAQAPQPGEGSALANNEAINSHLKTLRNAETTGPELQKAIEGLRQTHVQRDTQALSDQAKAQVEKDYTGSLTHVLTNENPSDKDVALAAHLVTKAQQEAKTAAEAGDTATHDAKIAEAVSIAERTDKILRESGRTSQAGSIIARLTPEGQLQYAARKLRQVRELNPKNITRENKTAGDIQKTVEDSVPQFDRNSVHQAVKSIAEGQQKLNLGGLEGEHLTPEQEASQSTGQKLAKNIETAVTPKIKQKADALVAELTKKVKQEYLEPKITAKRSPLSVLQEVFGRNAEAQDAYPLAQKILRDKFANVPKMQEALDKFFGSKLDLPAANTTIDRAISDQLKTSGERVSDVIYKSLTTQEATVKNVANDLVKEGFDPQSATKLSEEVAKRLNQQVIDAKTSALQRLAQDAKPKAQATYLDKINKFSNLGALTSEDYLHLARAKLNLPQLTPEIATKIHDLSQELQNLPEGHDKYALV
jgi:hypothetical protein